MLKVKLYSAPQNKARWLRWLLVIARCLPVAGGAVAFQRILAYQATDAAGMSAASPRCVGLVLGVSSPC
jgi:hypothetical protein